MKRPDVFTELEAAAVGCIALEGTCIRSAYVHDLYVLICDYKGVTVYVVVPDSFNRYAVLRRVLGHQLRFIPTAVSAADGAAIATDSEQPCEIRRGIPPGGIEISRRIRVKTNSGTLNRIKFRNGQLP